MKKELCKTTYSKTRRSLPSPEDLNAMRKRLQNLTVQYLNVSKKQTVSEENK